MAARGKPRGGRHGHEFKRGRMRKVRRSFTACGFTSVYSGSARSIPNQRYLENHDAAPPARTADRLYVHLQACVQRARQSCSRVCRPWKGMGRFVITPARRRGVYTTAPLTSLAAVTRRAVVARRHAVEHAWWRQTAEKQARCVQEVLYFNVCLYAEFAMRASLGKATSTTNNTNAYVLRLVFCPYGARGQP